MTKDLRRLNLDLSLLPLPRQNLIRRVADRSAALGMPCCLVGGFVRDALLNWAINDFDIVIEGDAIKLGKTLVKEFGGKLTSHIPFKTATWHLPSAIHDISFFDLITARSEKYTHPGALPTVKPSTIEDDLRRRDFTINALAVRLDGGHFGELLDPLNGQDDLARGLVRVLHPRSFVDDPTRMLRAVRYEKRYGFQIEPGTLSLFNDEARSVLSQLSGERLRHEFDLIFDEENIISMLTRLGELDLLRRIHSALLWDAKTRSRFSLYLESQAGRNNLWAVWLMDAAPAEIRSVGKRLHFTAETIKCALGASSVFHDLHMFAGMKPSQCVERLETFPDEAVLVVAKSIPAAKPREALETYLVKWKHIKPVSTGHDLKARGIPPGPKYRKILRCLRAAWVDGEVDSLEKEKKLLDDLLKEKRAAR